MRPEEERDRLNALSNRVIGAAIRVHTEIGPGMLERACESCLEFELQDQGLHVQRQVAMPLVYRSRRMDCGYRIDLLIEESLIVEVKSVERLERVHAAILQHYLRHSKLKLGLLINFNVKRLGDGIRRIVNGFPA